MDLEGGQNQAEPAPAEHIGMSYRFGLFDVLRHFSIILIFLGLIGAVVLMAFKPTESVIRQTIHKYTHQ